MIRRLFIVILLLGLGIPASAQSRLSLGEAMSRARAGNLDVRGSAAAEREADARTRQARASYLPTVDVSETWQRGDQPVFVFSSLLAQRAFTAGNFAIQALNHPQAIDNFRTALTIDQPIFSRATPINVRLARLRRESAAVTHALVQQDLAVAVTDAYGQVLVAAAARRAADAAVETAIADRVLATNRRDAGLVTDADVLQVDVHAARVSQRQIQSNADERIARARLNRLMGEPLDAVFVLDPPPAPAAPTADDVASLERSASEHRPEVKLASLHAQMARATRDSARAAFFPEVAAQVGWEHNGGAWQSRSTSWVVGLVARVNLFRGFRDRARLTEAREALTRRDIERENADVKARLDVRVAMARLDAARATLTTGRAAATQARESHRIIRDRYEGGLTDITSLLRAAEAVQQADESQIAAEVGVLVASAGLDRAVGKQ